MGAWIETPCASRRGLSPRVAPYVGAWIETKEAKSVFFIVWVAPYVGAWIETHNDVFSCAPGMSHPTWVRGLKRPNMLLKPSYRRRTLRGCVD